MRPIIRSSAATAACVVLIVFNTIAIVDAAEAGKTESPTTSTATTKPLPSTPREALREFARTIRDGDAAEMKAMIFAPSPREQQLVAAASEFVTAGGKLRQNLRARFGSDATKDLDKLELTPLDNFLHLITTGADKADEKITGDTATIGGGQTPWEVFLVRQNGKWMVDCTKMTADWTPKEWLERTTQIKQMANALHEMAGDIAAGQFASLAEFQQAVEKLAAGQQQ